MSVLIDVVWQAGADRLLGLPKYATTEAAGADLQAHLPPAQRQSGQILRPHARGLFATGIAVRIPIGFEAQIRPRSGLAWKHGITVLNAPGTIDSDYRGEIMVLLINTSTTAYRIEHGQRIAQMIIAPVVQAGFREAPALATSARAGGGFGSTGT